MNPIRYLDIFVLLMAAFPGEALRMGVFIRAGIRREAPVFGRTENWMLAIVCLALAVAGAQLTGLRPDWTVNRWVGIAAAVGLLVPFLEAGLGLALARMEGRSGGGVRFDAGAGKDTIAGIGIVLVGIAEELCYRVLWIGIAVAGIGLNQWLAVLASALLYSMAHWHLGGMGMLNRFISGAIFGGLFVVSGSLALVPVIAHATQNTTVVLLGRMRGDNA